MVVRASHGATSLLSDVRENSGTGLVEVWQWAIYGRRAMASSITYHCEDGTMEAHRSEIYVEGALTET